MSFLLILQSGEGWKTSLCRKEGKHQDKSEWGNPSPGSIAGSTKPWAWQNVESEYLLWMNKWDPIFVFMEAAMPKSAFSLFRGASLSISFVQGLWSCGQFAFTVNFQRLTSNFSSNPFLTIVLFYSAKPPWWVYCLCFLALWQFTSTGAPNTFNWHNTLNQSK